MIPTQQAFPVPEEPESVRISSHGDCPTHAWACRSRTHALGVSAGGGSRTLMPLRALDFESSASASSATPA